MGYQQFTVYRCKRCTRVTSFYPIGCYEKDCPIKKDWTNDFKWGMIIILSVFGLVIGSIIAFNLYIQSVQYQYYVP